ncbi:MAG: hypothetical protein OHK0013_06770 [Sandaracinaceae bacterium]
MEDPLPYDEEFLYHLSRGSEFLVANRMGEAKEELERALVVQPRDAKGQDLLAGVYFRLGVYPRAIELWTALVGQYPDDVPLRVNLGLALLKTAQIEEAIQHLSRAVELDASHGRAWGYLGLALWRAGKLDRARDAFVRGGQASMARRMEEMMSTTGAGSVSSPSLSILPSAPEVSSISGEVERLRTSGDPAPVLRARGARVERWASGRRHALEVVEPGRLVITPHADDVLVPRSRVVALRGERGGGRSAVVRVPSGSQAIASAPPEHDVHIVDLEVGEILYVVEQHLLAYEARAGGEARPLDGAPLRVVQLRGVASLALCTRREPVALRADDEGCVVDPTRLVGWSGRLFPATTSGGDGLVLRGAGLVLVA